jgi:hypothetical protein
LRPSGKSQGQHQSDGLISHCRISLELIELTAWNTRPWRSCVFMKGDCASGASARTQMRRTILRSKQGWRLGMSGRIATLTFGTVGIFVLHDPTASGAGTRIIVGKEGRLSGLRQAQHGCSSPHGMPYATRKTRVALGVRECRQHACFTEAIPVRKPDAHPGGTLQDKREISMHTAMSLRFTKLSLP